MIAVGQRALLFNGISFILLGFYTVYSSLFLALGKAGDGFILGSCRQGICFIPIIFILPEIFGINGIIYAQPVSDILSAVLAAIMALNLHKNIMTEKSIPGRWKGCSAKSPAATKKAVFASGS